MGFFDRYVELTPADGFRKARKSVRVFPVVRDVLLFLVLLIMLLVFWPLRTVPTGHRGVITVGPVRSVRSDPDPMVREACLLTLAEGSPFGDEVIRCFLDALKDPLPSVRVLVPGLCAMRGWIATPRFARLCPDAPGPALPEPY